MKPTQLKPDEVESLEIRDFKCIGPAQKVTFGALTVLSGANSTGKSTLMQPILLLKQTLDSTFDPGPLRLRGPNVNISSTAQLLSKVPGARTDGFEFCFKLSGGGHFRIVFSHTSNNGLDVELTERKDAANGVIRLRRGMTADEMNVVFPDPLVPSGGEGPGIELFTNRCFLDLRRMSNRDVIYYRSLDQSMGLTSPIQQLAGQLMHLPGLRGPRDRNYEAAAVSTAFAGTFDRYAASTILQWQVLEDRQKLDLLHGSLMELGLTWTVRAFPIEETVVELKVGRLPRRGRGGDDLVSIADVGAGIPQVLPILVALVAAEPGAFIYVEEPEMCLHPRAQRLLGGLFAKAAARGVRVVIETHSPVLLRSIQTLVARNELTKEQVKLHWCTRDSKTGATRVQLADLHDDGSFGEWPEDFADVELQVEQEYLDAASARRP